MERSPGCTRHCAAASVSWAVSSSRARSASRDELLSKSVQAAADACVDAERAGLEDDAADQRGVDVPGRVDPAAGGLGDQVDDLSRLLVGELLRGRQLDRQLALLGGDQPFELAVDLLHLGGPALF